MSAVAGATVSLGTKVAGVGCGVGACQGRTFSDTGRSLAATSGSAQRPVELLLLSMKKVRKVAVPAAKTPDPTKRAVRLQRPGVARESSAGLRVVTSCASRASDSLVTDRSRRRFASFRLASAILNPALSANRVGGRG